ncbi:MAG: hypothetical protein HY319_08820 [Armatimonadetes bacterium]|nr:hypothetical protein [Armatimonadota bacterium]
MRILWLFLLLCTAVGAQDYPVEVEMRLPGGRPAPSWRPPASPCRLCGQPRDLDGCGCDRLLDLGLARELQADVKTALRQIFQGEMELDGEVPVRTLSQTALNRRGGGHLNGLYEDGVIWLSHDLKRRQALGVLAHETAHAWQFQRHPDATLCAEDFREGFAEWVSFLVLEQAGDRASAFRLQANQDPVYGAGLRRFLELEARHGRAEILARARREVRF